MAEPDPTDPTAPDPTAGRRANSWVDDAPVDPTWAPPNPVASAPTPPPAADSRTAGSRTRSRRWLTMGIPLLAVILVIALVAALGGFKARTDDVVRMRVGQQFTTGPYEMVIEKATIQEIDGYGEDPRPQQVIVYVSVRNTWTEALVPDDEQFAATDRKRSERTEPEYVHLASSDIGPSKLAPGLPAQTVQIEFEFSHDFDPGNSVQFLASDLIYSDRSLFGLGDEMTWHNGGDRYLFDVPVTRLKAEEQY